MKQRNKISSLIIYATLLVLAVLFLLIGNRIATRNMTFFISGEDSQTVEARVTNIIDIMLDEFIISDIEHYELKIIFEATVGRGRSQEIIRATQIIGSHYLHNLREVQVGDRVIVINDVIIGGWI